MRQQLVERLQRPYDHSALELASPDARIAQALGVAVPSAASLAATLLDDLDEERFGIGWWHPHVPVRHSIVIGDHIHLAAASLGQYLVEARVHQAELEDVLDRQDARWRAHARVTGRFEMPPPTCAADELNSQLHDLHITGVLRAIGQALDCLAVVIIGVGDLPSRLPRASWTAITKRLEQPDSDFERDVAALVSASGPDAWIDWAWEVRNLYVHRPRMSMMSTVRVLAATLSVPAATPADRIHVAHHLPRTPTGSSIESMATNRTFGDYLLDEEVPVTIERLLHSTQRLIETAAARAKDEWERRRAESLVQTNHLAQWPTVGTSRHTFDGFATDSTKHGADTLRLHPSFGHRLRAAGLFEEDRPQIWADPAG